MGFEVTGRAPGKILWIGGYSVLERPNLGLVTTVDAHVSANIKSTEDSDLVIESPNLKGQITGSINLNTGMISINVPDELLLMKTAIEIASRYVASLGKQVEGMHVKTRNDHALAYRTVNGKVVKSGLGSSAAVTVAVIGSILNAYGIIPSDKEALHKLSQLAHSMATGRVGSGFDIAAATYGTIIYTRYSPSILRDFPLNYTNNDLKGLVDGDWDYKIEKIMMPKNFNLSFAKFVGEGMVTTSAVGSISEFKTRDPKAYDSIINEINEENTSAADALKRVKGGKEGALEEFRDAFEKGRALTKKLGILSNVGIEPDDCTRLIEDSKENGAFVAKLPGAGGKDAISAISLDTDSQTNLEKFWSSNSTLEVIRLNVANDGFQLEKPGRQES